METDIDRRLTAVERALIARTDESGADTTPPDHAALADIEARVAAVEARTRTLAVEVATLRGVVIDRLDGERP